MSNYEAEWDAMMSRIKDRNLGQDAFLQAVTEVAKSVKAIIKDSEPLQNNRIFERLTEPDRIVIFRVVWEDDVGGVQINRGYRVQHCGAIGPYKGGIRFHPSVDLSTLKFLAFEQTFKNALTGLPMGGAKGGSDFDPKGRSEREIMRFCQAFMDELFRHIGPHTDVPAGDINVGAREIGYMYGRYRRLTNRFSGAMTGKGLAYGGSPARVEATGYGLIYFLQNVLEAHLDDIKNKTILISGAGNVALHAAEKAVAVGAKVITLSDSNGTLINDDGFTGDDIAWIKDHKAQSGASLKAFTDQRGGKFKADATPWSIKADIALPCATQNEIDADDAKALVNNGIKYLAEGANMPCTAKATETIRDKGIIYVPGKASNAGGVALSGLEMSQNAAFERGDFDTLNTHLKTIMTRIHESCKTYGKVDDHIDYVRGANRAAFTKVSDALLAFGI